MTSTTRPGISIGAQNARGLFFGPLLDVELDVLLRLEVDPHVGERRLERRQHLLGRELRIPLGRAERADHVPAPGLVEPDPDAGAEEPVRRLLEHLLGRVEEVAALSRQVVEAEAEAAIELRVVRRLEALDAVPDDADALGVERVQMLLGELDPRLVDPFPLVAVRLVRHRGPEHPERDRLAVDLGLEGRFELGHLLGLVARQFAEVALRGEAPELGHAAVAVRGLAECERLVELRQVGEALEDRGELELVLVARVVEVVLLVQLRDEAVGPVAEAVEVSRCQRRGRAGQGFVG